MVEDVRRLLRRWAVPRGAFFGGLLLGSTTYCSAVVSTSVVGGAVVTCSLVGGAVVLTTACQRQPELPVLGTMPEFAFTDQDGKPFTNRDLSGQLSVAAFIFTRCPTVCPRITTTMRQLQKRAQAASIPIHWLSFSVDPDNDTPSVLNSYAQKYEADLSQWSFLTGDAATIRQTAEQGFKIAAEGSADPGAEHYGISHGSHLVLIDGHGQIRGYYRTSDTDAQTRLLTDAKALMP